MKIIGRLCACSYLKPLLGYMQRRFGIVRSYANIAIRVDSHPFFRSRHSDSGVIGTERQNSFKVVIISCSSCSEHLDPRKNSNFSI